MSVETFRLDGPSDAAMIEDAAELLGGTMAWERYDNPFEQKAVVARRLSRQYPLNRIRAWMNGALRRCAERTFGLSLAPTDQWSGFMRYSPGDRLSVHVDAGVHPETGQRKAVTALLYLSDGAPLEFWDGDNCNEGDPRLHGIQETVAAETGLVVLFVNHDYAWHGVGEQQDGDRYVATVSYVLAPYRPQADWALTNPRAKAYFVPRPGEEWTEEMYRLRDERADAATAAGVYRRGV